MKSNSSGSAPWIAIRDGLGACVAILVASILGILVSSDQSKRAMEYQLGEWLTTSARSLSGLVEPALFTSLSRPEDESGPAYSAIYSRIHDFRRRNPAFRFAYTCVLSKDSVFFAVDGTPPGDADGDGVEDHSALFAPYPQASGNLRKVLSGGVSGFDAKPYTDPWGTFRSGCAGIMDARGKTIGAACVDMDVAGFRAHLLRLRNAEMLGIFLAILVSTGVGFAVFLIRRKQISFHGKVILMGRDLEQRNKTLMETQTRLIESQQQAGLGHWTIYPADGDTEWSEEMYRIHGIAPGQAPLSLEETIHAAHPEDREAMGRAANAVLEDGKPREWKYRRMLPDGSTRHLFVRARGECDAQGHVKAVNGITQDMTLWHAIQDELTEAKVRAERADKAKSEFLAMMSHEIRTPMNGVLGMAHLLKDSPMNPDQVSLLTTLLDSGDHLMTLINDILDFSKIEAGSMELEAIPFDLKRLGLSVCGALRQKVSGAEIELQYNFALTGGDIFLGDPGRIRQILFNLVGNALKFTQSGHVRLVMEPVADREGWLSMTIEDSGIGMTAEQVEKLFRPFIQADSSMSRKYGGTGLGLAITFKLVELMRGKVSVESALGKGSRFQVLLPMSRAAAASGHSLDESDLESIPNQSGLRVLLIGDKVFSRMVIRRQLESLRILVWEASSFAEAAAILGKRTDRALIPEFGIVDWSQPLEDGSEACRALRSHDANTRFPLLLLSRNVTLEDSRIAQAAGFDAFLVNPESTEILAGAIYLARKKGAESNSPLITRELVQKTGLRLPEGYPSFEAGVAQSDWSLSRPHVLLAEDNVVNQKVGVRMLEKLGYRVTLAANGLEALKLVLAGSVDLILMDCMMPEMDGYESTRAIREREKALGKRIPIIACTANVTQDEIRKCQDAGMDDFLSKPYKPEKLKEAVEKWAKTEHQA